MKSRRRLGVKKGRCKFCNKSGAKNGIIKHVIEQHLKKKFAPAPSEGGGETQFVILAKGRDDDRYWRLLLVKSSTPCKELYQYVKRWVDCGCGHMESSTIPEAGTLGQILRPGYSLSYAIDIYGSATGVMINVMEAFTCGEEDAAPVQLIGECLPPSWTCTVCSEPAVAYCRECAFEFSESIYEGSVGFCEVCGDNPEDHPCAKKKKRKSSTLGEGKGKETKKVKTSAERVDSQEKEMDKEDEGTSSSDDSSAEEAVGGIFTVQDNLMTSDRVLQIITSPRFGICGFL